MEAVTQVRANQTQMSLSLIATVFLPMTFLAGAPTLSASPVTHRHCILCCTLLDCTFVVNVVYDLTLYVIIV